MGTASPKSKLFVFDLKQRQKIRTNENGELIQAYEGLNFDLTIDLNLVEQGFIKEFTSGIQPILGMSWVPFDNGRKTLRYYTAGEDSSKNEEKLDKLNRIFAYAEKFEKDYADLTKSSREEYERAMESFKRHSDGEMTIDFDRKSRKLVAAAHGYLGRDLYGKLFSASSKVGKVDELGLDSSLFDGERWFKKNETTCFVISPTSYSKIAELMMEADRERTDFLNRQAKEFKSHSVDFPEITEKNPFGIKISFNEKEGCFEVYLKGYEKNEWMGFRAASRNLLERWSLSFICSEAIEGSQAQSEAEEKKTHEHDGEVDLPNGMKILVPMRKIGGVRGTRFVSAEYWRELAKIKNNYDREMALFGRPAANVPIRDKRTRDWIDGSGTFNRHPAIYFDDSGHSFFAYGYAVRIGRTKLGDPPVEGRIILKAVEISFAEAEFYLNEHCLASEIRENSASLNVQRLFAENAPMRMGEEERAAAFEDLLFRTRLLVQTRDNSKKTKKLKI